jgi:hypothetical protein
VKTISIKINGKRVLRTIADEEWNKLLKQTCVDEKLPTNKQCTPAIAPKLEGVRAYE